MFAWPTPKKITFDISPAIKWQNVLILHQQALLIKRRVTETLFAFSRLSVDKSPWNVPNPKDFVFIKTFTKFFRNFC